MSEFTNPAGRAPTAATAYVRAVIGLVGVRDPIEVMNVLPGWLEARTLGIDDAEAGMSQGNPLVGGNPMTLAVGATMPQTAGRPLQRGGGNRFTLREKGHNTAHSGCLFT